MKRFFALALGLFLIGQLYAANNTAINGSGCTVDSSCASGHCCSNVCKAAHKHAAAHGEIEVRK